MSARDIRKRWLISGLVCELLAIVTLTVGLVVIPMRQLPTNSRSTMFGISWSFVGLGAVLFICMVINDLIND